MVYLHGTPDSRLARHPDDELSAEAGVRLLAVDRPGYGSSAPPGPGTTATEVGKLFAADVRELLDRLGVDEAVLLAWSGGALPALALAASPDLTGRVTELVVVAGVVPREAYDDPAVGAVGPERGSLFELADDMPPAELGEMVAPMLAPYPCDGDLAAEHQRERRDQSDQAALAGVPGAVEQMAAALVEAVRNGVAGVAADVVAQHYPDAVPTLEQVDLPVRLWYGSNDQVAPPAFGSWYAKHLPNAELTIVEGAGHVLFFTHWPQLLTHMEGAE